VHEAILKDVRLKKMEKFWRKDEDPTFQIRSSWAQFRGIVRFWRVAESITYVFSTAKIFRLPPPPPTFISLSRCARDQGMTNFPETLALYRMRVLGKE
jgi:hypothetical protein